MAIANITSMNELRTALRTISAVGATIYKSREEGPRVKAAIARFAWRLTIDERAEMHSIVVSQVAKEFGLKAHTSSKEGGWGFYPQTFSETSKAGKAANSAVRFAAGCLRPTTKAQADAYIAKHLAPKVIKVASSKDKVAAAIKVYAKLTTAQRIAFMAAMKAV